IGESVLGDVIADAQREAMGTDIAFMNPGGIRAGIFFAQSTGEPTGHVTWGELFTVQPFGNSLVKMNLTGAQIKAVLEQQWQQPTVRILQVSGITYTWDPTAPIGSRVFNMVHNGTPIDPAATYTVTVNNFLAAGGDGFTALTGGTNQQGGPIDLDALVA